ncbi:tRNA 2-thiouridine(34) synthase MnmA [Oerskovia turbata]
MRVLAAMSGGVDSAVAAALAVEAGHEVVGVHMALSRNREQFRAGSRGCCSIEDAGDARRAADILGIPYYVWDLSERFEDTVVADFLSEYEAGRTPNPCVRCNEHIKFEALLDKATALGFDAVATGHYAQILTREVTETGPDGEPVTRTVRELHRSPNEAKDQSYVLAVMGQERLARSVFPLGGFASKDEVRAEAERRGLSVSNKPDSYDICFVSDGDTQGFLKARLGARAGEIVDTSGEVLGEHEGAYAFTVGQRKGLALGRPAADGKPRYVLEVEPVSNRVVVGPAELLTVDRIEGDRSVWLADDVLAAAGWADLPAETASGPEDAARVPGQPATASPTRATGWFDASVQVRAHGAPVPARVRAVVGPLDGDTAEGARMEVELTGEKLRGVAAGQSLVVYQGTRVVGQSTVLRAHRAQPASAVR